MKKMYEAPEAKRIGFAPEEALATSFDDLLGGSGGVIPGGGLGDETIASAGDITLEGVGNL